MRTVILGKLREEQLMLAPKGRSIGDDASQRAIEGLPEGQDEREGTSQRPRSAIALHLLKSFPLKRLLDIERGGDYAKAGGFF